MSASLESSVVEILPTDDCTDCGIVVINSDVNEVEEMSESTATGVVLVEKLFQCEQCEKTFTQASNLKRHERTHTGERPFSCPTCGRCFAQGNNLKAHMRLHSGERPYACALCDRTFAQSSNMYKHMRKHGGGADGVGEQTRRFGCAICDKWFLDSNMLKMHLRTHTGERPYACDLCDRTFAQDSNLRRHRRIHTGEKPYKCPICSRCFSQSNNVKAHMSVHVGAEDSDHVTQDKHDLLDCDESFEIPIRLSKSKLTSQNRHKVVVIDKNGMLQTKPVHLSLVVEML